jgi:hypothetical protein
MLILTALCAVTRLSLLILKVVELESWISLQSVRGEGLRSGGKGVRGVRGERGGKVQGGVSCGAIIKKCRQN